MSMIDDNPLNYNHSEIAESQASAAMLRVGELRAALLNTKGLDHIPEPEPLIDGIIHRDSLVWLIGKSGDGKSFVALDMTGSIGTGRPWHGHPTTPGTVLYIVAEGATGIRWRVRAWEYHHDTDMTDVHWLPRPVQAALELDWHALIDLTHEMNPILIVIDTQARVTVGMEENAAKDMGVFVDQLEDLRRASKACVMIVHHQGRNGEHMRGSTALEGAAGTVIRIVKDETEITLTCEKQKDAEPFKDIRLRLVPTLDSAVVLTSDSMSQAALINSAAVKMAEAWWDLFEDETVSAAKIIDAGLVTKPRFFHNIKQLTTNDIVTKQMTGRFVRYQMVRPPNRTSPDLDLDDQAGTWQGPHEVRSLEPDINAGHDTSGPVRSAEVRSGPADHGSVGPVSTPLPLGRGRPDRTPNLEPDPTPTCQCGQPLLNTKSVAAGKCARCRLKEPE